MTFEEDKFQQATLLLKDMERECAGDIGWLKSVKSKVFRAEETDVSFFSFLLTQFYLVGIFLIYYIWTCKNNLDNYQ